MKDILIQRVLNSSDLHDYTVIHIAPYILNLLLLIDLIALCILVFSKNINISRYKIPIIMIHGSVPSIIIGAAYIQLHGILLILTVILISALYLVFHTRRLFTKIIITINCSLMALNAEYTLCGTSKIGLFFLIILIITTTTLYILLALLKFNSLQLIHIIYTVFRIFSYILKELVGVPIFGEEFRNGISVFGAFTFGILIISTFAYWFIY